MVTGMNNHPDFSSLVNDILILPDYNMTILGGEVGLSVQAIMRLRDGEVINPTYSVGDTLVRLHRRLKRRILKAAA